MGTAGFCSAASVSQGDGYIMEQPKSRNLSHKYMPIALILVGFLLFESYLFFYHSIPLTRDETNGIEYMQRADSTVFKVDAFHGPGYPWAIRLVHLAGLDLFTAAKVVSLFFGLMFLVATWLLLSSITTVQNALLATVLTATNHIIIFRSVLILSDVMAASLMLMGLAVVLGSKDAGRKNFICAGALCGLAYLTRYIDIVALAIPLLWLLLAPRGPARLQRAVLFYLGFILVTAPWLVFLYSRTGNPFWNLHYLNVAYAMYRDGHDSNIFPSENQFHGLLDVFYSNPVLFSENLIENLFRLPWTIIEMFSHVGVLAGAGFLIWLENLDWKKATLLATMLLYSLLLCLVWLEDRFILLFLPVTASFIATCILVLPTHVILPTINFFSTRASCRIPLRNVVAVVSVAAMAALTVISIRPYFSDQAPEYMIAADWLSAQAKGSIISVMAAKPHIAFFSNSRSIVFKNYKLQVAKEIDLPAVLQEAGPTYFVYDERYASVEFPQFSKLLSPKTNPYPTVLEPVWEIKQPRALVIYKYLGGQATP